MVAEAVATQYPELVSHAFLIWTAPPGRNNNLPEKIFWESAFKVVNDLDDLYILFFEPQSESSKNADRMSYQRIVKRTEDLDIPVPKELGVDQKKAFDSFREEYDTLEKLKMSKIPILVIMGDHDILCPVENWYGLGGKLPSTQFIVMPQAGHTPHHQYPDLAAKYIAAFIQNLE